MIEAKHTPAIAKYKLQIKSNTGYSSTTTGECTPGQYSAALAAIDGECSSTLVRAAPDLLDALKGILWYFDSGNSVPVSQATIKAASDEVKAARAAIAKVEGGAK